MASSTIQVLPMLFSMSVAASNEVDSDDSESPYVIKNTFIEVAGASAASGSSRRSTSAPPKAQSSNVSDSGLAPSRSLPCNLESSPAWSTVSTSAQEEDDILSSCWDTATTLDNSDAASVASGGGGVTISLSDLVPPKRTPLRAALNLKAKAWKPSQTTSTSPGLPLQVRCRFAEIVGAGQQALTSSGVMQKVERLEAATEWSLIGSFPPANLQRCQHSLEAVKAAILHAAAQSSDVYVVGYENAPFAPLCGSGGLNLGFRAQLALVQDESSACWDLLTQGLCHRGCKCRWQHPSWQVSFDVVLKQIPPIC